MEQLKKRRTSLRTAFTKAINSLNVLLDDVTSGTADTTVAFGLAADKYKDLEAVAAKVFDELLKSDTSEENVQKEYDEHDTYKSKFMLAKFKFESRIAARNSRAQSEISNTSFNGGNVIHTEFRKSYNLPKIELAKFGGDVRDWLQFWSLFKKIHEDSNMENEDKFQYLIQAMIPESRAAQLVLSYPPTGENYKNAIDSLKKRFGRDDLQIEVYVRELLQLVLQNAMSSKEMPLASLYDKIESYLRALNTLGVTTDKCAAMLFPLVESSLPEELLRVWQRTNRASETSTTNNASNVSEISLNRLINFLESEVQSEVRVSMAKKGFNFTKENETERTKKTKSQALSKDVPSARNLLAAKGKEALCVFCEKTDHDSAKCLKVKNMSTAEKLEAAKKKRACFKCLTVGHNSRFCRVNTKCTKCGRRHVDIMCYVEEKPADSTKDKTPTSVSAINMKECNLASSSAPSTTFMPTLKVKIRSDTKELTVRAVIDSGSQNSYILQEIVDQLNYQPIAKQNLVHLLFGGEKTDVASHNKYLIHIGSMDDSYRCNFQALDEKVICADVPSITKGSWLRELGSLNVVLTDVCSAEKDVAILIGADVAGKLLTGRLHVLSSGLTAVETYLGWTLMGKVPSNKAAVDECENSAVSAISMFMRDADVKDLWSLDV